MSNPNLRVYKMSGGPFDGQWATVLPEILDRPPDDDGSGPPPYEHRRVIFVKDEGEMEMRYRGQAVISGKRSVFFRYVLFAPVGKPEAESVYRYVHEGVWTEVADDEGVVIHPGNIKKA